MTSPPAEAESPTSPSRTLPNTIIEENVTRTANEVVALAGTDYTEALQRMADLGLTSGAICDMLHVICAEKAEADDLRTFNEQDFRRMPPGGASGALTADPGPKSKRHLLSLTLWAHCLLQATRSTLLGSSPPPPPHGVQRPSLPPPSQADIHS